MLYPASILTSFEDFRPLIVLYTDPKMEFSELGTRQHCRDNVITVCLTEISEENVQGGSISYRPSP